MLDRGGKVVRRDRFERVREERVTIEDGGMATFRC
jgi:hypothetical protein